VSAVWYPWKLKRYGHDQGAVPRVVCFWCALLLSECKPTDPFCSWWNSCRYLSHSGRHIVI